MQQLKVVVSNLDMFFFMIKILGEHLSYKGTSQGCNHPLHERTDCGF